MRKARFVAKLLALVLAAVFGMLPLTVHTYIGTTVMFTLILALMTFRMQNVY